jgi:hypothetical protein
MILVQFTCQVKTVPKPARLAPKYFYLHEEWRDGFIFLKIKQENADK